MQAVRGLSQDPWEGGFPVRDLLVLSQVTLLSPWAVLLQEGQAQEGRAPEGRAQEGRDQRQLPRALRQEGEAGRAQLSE